MQRLRNTLGIVDVDEVVSELEPSMEAHKARRRARNQQETPAGGAVDNSQQQQQQQQQPASPQSAL